MIPAEEHDDRGEAADRADRRRLRQIPAHERDRDERDRSIVRQRFASVSEVKVVSAAR
jgi:hypothetical protein